MTEKEGGSDVNAATRTQAMEQDGKCRLYGYKWFSSATDADMSLTLARFPQSKEELESNKGKIGLVFLETRKSDGSLNNIDVVRLKDKMGTRQLPTAELVLNGSVGNMLSKPGEGIKQISNMLNITRLHNAIASCSFLTRIVALAVDYSYRRSAFGRKLIDLPLHKKTLMELTCVKQGCDLFLLECARLLGE